MARPKTSPQVPPGHPPAQPPDSPRVAFARRFREAREAAGLTQAQLARRMGVFPQQVSQIELKGAVPHAAAISQASAELGVDFTAMVASIAPPGRAAPGRPSGPKVERTPVDPDSFVGRMVAIRKARGLTQAELGARMVPPLAQPHVYKMEAGKTELSRDTIERLARALECDPADLDVRLIPRNAVNLVRKRPRHRWVAQREADAAKLAELGMGGGAAGEGLGTGEVAALALNAADKRVAVVLRGDLPERGEGEG